MSKTRREEQHAAIREEIKTAARRLMAKEGTAGVSIRGIGRAMDMTAPALYHYYPSREALITDLIVDAFSALAGSLEQARDHCSEMPAADRLREVLLAYRQWALAFPLDFQLIYGNPIPDYDAPGEVTVPAATRSFLIIAGLIDQAMNAPTFCTRPEYSSVPEAMQPSMQNLASQLAKTGVHLPQLALYITTVGWPRIHGILMLELFHHIQPVVGDVDTFYRMQVDDLIRSMGLMA